VVGLICEHSFQERNWKSAWHRRGIREKAPAVLGACFCGRGWKQEPLPKRKGVEHVPPAQRAVVVRRSGRAKRFKVVLQPLE
jgi:hypothetical protein